MSSGCKCEACKVQRHYDELHAKKKIEGKTEKNCGPDCKCKKSAQDDKINNIKWAVISGNTSNTAGTSSFTYWVDLAQAIVNPPVIGAGYRLTLSGPETEEGYFVKFTTDIDIFEFTNLYAEFMSRGSIELDYNGEEGL